MDMDSKDAMTALLVVDVQNDFCPGGTLAVPGGDEVVGVINELLPRFSRVVFTQDWHPSGHVSFASSHRGKVPHDTVELQYGRQILWPDHCVPGTPGARFHPDLDVTAAQAIIRKGHDPALDSYSGFLENDHQTPTGLGGYLQQRGMKRIVVVGLAADFCVKYTALDGLRMDLDVTVLTDATRGIDVDGSLEQAWQEMDDAGVHLVTSDRYVP